MNRVLVIFLTLFSLQVHASEIDMSKIYDKFDSYDDYIKISVVVHREGDGRSELKKSYTTIASKDKTRSPRYNPELEAIYIQVKELIDTQPKAAVSYKLHSIMYKIEVSNLGIPIELRLHKDMSSSSPEGKAWIEKASLIHTQIYDAITKYASPNKQRQQSPSGRTH